MLLTKVILENYGVFRDKNVFDFTCTENKPIILFGGTNGSGKTTLFESIMLCLYGISFFEKKISRKEYEKFLTHKIHRYLGTPVSADVASITVDFQFYHQSKVYQYLVSRSWNVEEGKVIENFSIKRNNESLDSLEESEWQSFIEELIPKGIAKLFFFDGEKITKIAEDGNEDLEIKTSFDTLLGLDLVKQLSSDLRIHLLRLAGGKEKEVQEKLDALVKEKEESRNKIGDLREKEAIINSEIDNVTKTIEVLEAKISKIGGRFASKRDELVARRDYLKIKLTVVEDNIRALCTDQLPFALMPKELKLLEEQLNADQELLKKQFEKEILDRNFEEIKSSMTSDKFWAELQLDKIFKDKIVSKVSEILDTKLQLKEKLNQNGVINFSTQETAQILSSIDRINELPKQLEKEASEFNSITDELRKIETALANAPKDDEVGPLITELNSHHENIGSLKKEIEHLHQRIGQEQALIRITTAKIRNLVDEKYKDRKATVQAEMAETVQKILNEYAAKLKIKKLQLLENYLIEAIRMLMHKENFIDKVSIDNETFEITLYRKDGNMIPKDMLSKGEKQMLATGVLWALAKTSGKPLPFIIDTPLARLDVEHRKNLVEKFYPFTSHQIVIFSTNSEIDKQYYTKLKPFVSRSYLMEYLPNQGKSRVREGYFGDSKEGEVVAV